VLVHIEAVPLLSYLKRYVEGKLAFYSPPPGKFTPGTNGVGVIEAVGRDVWHLRPGQRVVLSPHFVAAENVEDPAQILIGLTTMGAGTAAMQADWRDGTLAELALSPAATVTPAEGLDAVAAAQLAVLNRTIVPYGGLLRGRLAAGETLIVNGATGAYGTPAVLLGLALGAARVLRQAAMRRRSMPWRTRPGGEWCRCGSAAISRLTSPPCAPRQAAAPRLRSTWSDRLRTPTPPWPPCTACAAAAGWF
jgi:alcohol dehydrogenase